MTALRRTKEDEPLERLLNRMEAMPLVRGRGDDRAFRDGANLSGELDLAAPVGDDVDLVLRVRRPGIFAGNGEDAEARVHRGLAVQTFLAERLGGRHDLFERASDMNIAPADGQETNSI